ncbi:hypothetical protein IT397_02075 [Candidatus Nomurabacteria bacterium]|nr:hypothetical protein [Candidatus Nomurabacteria bacterium]
MKEKFVTPSEHEILRKKIVELSHELEESDNPEYIKENLPILLELIEKDLGIKLLKSSETDNIYKLLEAEGCLLRVEKLSRVIEAIELDKPLDVGEGDSHYANAVIPNNDGIKLALAEGQAPGPVRMAIGFGGQNFGKTLVGFRQNKEHFKIEEVEFSPEDLRDIEKRSFLCRHVDGRIEKEDIRAVVMRIPKHLMSAEILTDDEKETSGQFVFRSFIVGPIPE